VCVINCFVEHWFADNVTKSRSSCKRIILRLGNHHGTCHVMAPCHVMEPVTSYCWLAIFFMYCWLIKTHRQDKRKSNIRPPGYRLQVIQSGTWVWIIDDVLTRFGKLYPFIGTLSVESLFSTFLAKPQWQLTTWPLAIVWPIRLPIVLTMPLVYILKIVMNMWNDNVVNKQDTLFSHSITFS